MAKGRGLCAALVFAAALGCSREDVPSELIGRWTTDDPRYADRALVIGTEQVAFGVDAGIRVAYRTQGIEREADAEAGTLYRLYYDAPGEPERELRVRLFAPGRLHIDNHDEFWTRAGAPTTGG
jgi:hypothetical protein